MIDVSVQAKSHQGFTLIEIMVALVIFAVLSVTLLVRIGDSIRSEQYLEEKTLASVVAENKLAKLRVDKEWSAVHDGNETLEFMGRKWEVKLTTKSAGYDNFRQVDVLVKPAGSRNQKTTSYLLTGFIGKQ
ncbi:MAG: type II secretion system minor pseudopilin GspI [Pseudomonadales bacterium]|nr:type II secretion system minor pseudopilin GspI [Pseudomonadales bacterium]